MKTLPFLLLLLMIGCSKESILNPDGTFTDSRDKREYKWVRIGEQVWMAENLAYLPVVGPHTMGGSETKPNYYVYNFEGTNVNDAKATANYKTYGALYNWESSKTACPFGWHLPNNEEWRELEMFLGMRMQDLDIEGGRESGSVGKKLKSSYGWYNNGNGDNSSGFNALPAGSFGSAGDLGTLGSNTHFWSSAIGDATNACRRVLSWGSDGVWRDYVSRSLGSSVRCLKNQ